MRVSVVVPVFNSGEAVTALLDSLRAQTLPAGQWEAVFVDDGSSDGTAEVVEGLIAADPHMRLLREAPSGWPGRPRNVGLDAAIGDFVFFCDDDDTLGPEALERLTDFAIAHDADVVVPRTVGRNRGVPAMTRTVVDAQDEPALIMSSLAPQKLFRRAFLQRAGIRFPEGPFRLEDHLFVVTAYLRARRVSTYADYPAYYLSYQPGRAHISQQAPDWHAYFGSVRACLDRVDEEARDDRMRRAMRGRWLRAESLSRLRGDAFTKLGTPQLMEEVRRLLVDRYDAAELAALKPVDRLVALLLIDGRDDDVAALAHWESSMRVTTEARAASIDPDGTVRLTLRSDLSPAGPLPSAMTADDRYPAERDLLEQVGTLTRVAVDLQHATTKVRRQMRVEHRDGGIAQAVLAPSGEPLEPGEWTVVAASGERRAKRRSRVVTAAHAALAAAPVRVDGRTIAFRAGAGPVLVVRERGADAHGALPALLQRASARLLSRGLRTVRAGR